VSVESFHYGTVACTGWSNLAFITLPNASNKIQKSRLSLFLHDPVRACHVKHLDGIRPAPIDPGCWRQVELCVISDSQC
jgi:hypothetical protein